MSLRTNERIPIDPYMKLVFFAYCFLILSSCQWFQERKDTVLTRLASQATDDKITEDQKRELMVLFVDIRNAEGCPYIQSQIEKNKILRYFEEEFDVPTGFLFDGLIDYDYEVSLRTRHRNRVETVVFSIVSVWKTAVSLAEIEGVINKVRKCYPDEYLNSQRFTEAYEKMKVTNT